VQERDLVNERHTISLVDKTGSDTASFVNLTDDKGRSYSLFSDFLEGFSPKVALVLSPSQAIVQTNTPNAIVRTNTANVDASVRMTRWKDFRSFIQQQAADRVNIFGSPKSLNPWQQELSAAHEKIYLFDGTQLSEISLIDAAILIYLQQMKVSAPSASYPKLAMVPLSPACGLTAASEGEALVDVCKDSVGNEPFRAKLEKGSLVVTRLNGKAGEAFVEIHPARPAEPQRAQAKTAAVSKFKVNVPAPSPYINPGPPICNCSGTVALSEQCFVECKKQCDYNVVSFNDNIFKTVQGALSKKSCLSEIYKFCGMGDAYSDMSVTNVGRLGQTNDDCFMRALNRWGSLQAEQALYSCYMGEKPARLMTAEDANQLVRGFDKRNFSERGGMTAVRKEFNSSSSLFGFRPLVGPSVDPRTVLKEWYTSLRGRDGFGERFVNYQPFISRQNNPVARFYSPQVNAKCAREASGLDTSLPALQSVPRRENPRRVVFDNQCNAIAYDERIDNKRICSNTSYRSIILQNASPIALLWDRDSDLNRSVSLTSFPLDPREKGKVYQWKASGETPLLVYDPAGTGKILSATQLFGNWTFGHKDRARVKRIGLAYPAESSKPLWSNGYEALALLDDNNDGEISGDERIGLSLWFDRNQDGVSDKGEVQNLISAGVERLSVRYDGRDAEGDIYSNAGFTRRLSNGDLLTHRTIDWFSPAFDSKQDALDGLAAAPESSSPAVNVVSSGDPITRSAARPSRFNGTWRYTLEDPGTEGLSIASKLGYNGGVMKLSVDEAGEVHGFTISEAPVTSDREPASSIAFIQPLKGRLIDANTVEFSLDRFDGEGSLVSRVNLRDNGEILGKTAIQTSRASGEGKTVSYTWRAIHF
jgi:hypothetical protein